MDKNDIIEIKDFFDEADAKTIWAYHTKPRWKFGHGSNHADDIRFWQMELSDDEYFSKELYRKVLEEVGEDYVLERVYANGHVFGTCGAAHHDSFNTLARTVLYYANPIWKPAWGGKTAFSLNDENHYVLPEPNKLVIFPGIIPHWAEESSRSSRD